MIAAKWQSCTRCDCSYVLVESMYGGPVLCDECVAERGTLQTSPLTQAELCPLAAAAA
jgi:hypothetical protein